jgi:hypothetical protein
MDIKSKLLNHFYTRKQNFILGKPTLTLFEGKERFDVSSDYVDKKPRFKIDHGLANIYFSNVEDIVDFIEKKTKNAKDI